MKVQKKNKKEKVSSALGARKNYSRYLLLLQVVMTQELRLLQKQELFHKFRN